MSDVAILGAGPIGAAIAHKLAERSRVRDVTLVDASAAIAAGKALDIMQSGPVGRFDTRISSSGDVLAAAGAGIIVVADLAADSKEWAGEPGLGLVRQLARAGASAPIVFAGASQLQLMEVCYRELHLPAQRLIGTAPSALVAAVRALAGIELGLAAADVVAAGKPPELVIGWSSATVAGTLLTERIAAHRLLAISDALARFWPPGPQAIGAATAPIVEALLSGSRKLHSAATILEGEFGARGVAAMLPLELGNRRVLSRTIPTLSPQERTELMNGL